MIRCGTTYLFLIDVSPQLRNSVVSTESPLVCISYHRNVVTESNNKGDANMDNHQRRWVGLGGLALVVVLLATVFLTPNGPDTTASPEKVAVFARHNQTGLYLSAYLISLAVLIAGAFLWYLRDVIAPAEPGRRLAD